MARPYSVGKPIVVAHRGGAGQRPENSPEAFAAMRALGFRHMETDARATLDGVAVLCHDPTLDRTTDAKGPVSSFTWRELRRVGRPGGGRIARVEDVLRDNDDMFFVIDAKDDRVLRPLVEAIRAAHAQDRVCVASFSERRLRRLRSMLPGTASSLGVAAVARMVGASRAPGPVGRRLLAGVPGPAEGVVATQVPVRTRGVTVVAPDFLRLAHARGLAVHAWTINDVDEAARLLDMGVDGIVTDRPELVRSGLTRRGYAIGN